MPAERARVGSSRREVQAMKVKWMILSGVLVLVVPLVMIVAAANSGQPFLPAEVETRPDAYDVGMAAYDSGDYTTAMEVLPHVPPDHPRYARAMRFLGFNVLTRAKDQPKEGLRYVNASILRDPFDGNVWQDAYRIYLRSLGIDA